MNKIATQGRPAANQWVTSYKLLFSSDGANWNEYQNNGVVKVNAVKETRSLASRSCWVSILRRPGACQPVATIVVFCYVRRS